MQDVNHTIPDSGIFAHSANYENSQLLTFTENMRNIKKLFTANI